MSVNKAIISTLSVCLLSVVGLFLYSEYQPSQTEPDNSTIVKSTSPVAPSNATSIQESISNKVSSDTTEQPDKSLPIPAHQLKKVIAESNDSAADDLQQKIDALDKKLADIDQKLLSSEAGPSVSGSIASAQDASSSDDETEQRIQHIRDHLEK